MSRCFKSVFVGVFVAVILLGCKISTEVTLDKNETSSILIEVNTTDKNETSLTPIEVNTTDKNDTSLTPIEVNTTDKNETSLTPIEVNTTDKNETSLTPIEVNTTQENTREIERTIIQATAKLGNLANADVTIYRVEDDGILIPLYTETTSNAKTLSEIGKFDMHVDALEDDTFYLYKITGGKDYDSNDDGNLDATPTENNGTIRAIAKGSDLKAIADNFIVSYTTELVYEQVAAELKYNFNKTTFTNKLQDAIKKVIMDINGDGNIDEKDMLIFNPQADATKLIPFYKRQIKTIKDTLHKGNIPILNFSYKLGSYDTGRRTMCVKLSHDGTKAFVAKLYNDFTIIDINDSAKPIKIGSLGTSGYTCGISLSSDDTKAYVADGTNGLVILDISNPTNIVKLGAYKSIDYILNVSLSHDGTKAYLAAWESGLVVVDITNPASPTKLSSYNTIGFALDAVLSNNGKKAYVADGTDGLDIIDLTLYNW